MWGPFARLGERTRDHFPFPLLPVLEGLDMASEEGLPAKEAVGRDWGVAQVHGCCVVGICPVELIRVQETYGCRPWEAFSGDAGRDQSNNLAAR